MNHATSSRPAGRWATLPIAVPRAALACLAGFGLAILPASLAQATYGPRTIIGTNYQQWSDTQSVDTVNEGSCSGQPVCYTLFQRVPQGKSLIVQHVSCRVSVDAGELGFGVLWARKRKDHPDRMTEILPVNTSGTQWVVSSPVMYLLKSNERPLVAFAANKDTNWSLACNISGRLVEP